MSVERTISIIKPDAIFKKLIGIIIGRFESSGLAVVAIKMLQLTRDQVEEFYDEHRRKSFFKDLVDFIISGPVIVQILEGYNAVRRNREIMGSTNPQEALTGTIRADYADNYIRNVLHGSDSLDAANREISYFFKEDEICSSYFKFY